MPRRTKIVATLGPASSDAKTLARMIEAGLDVVRVNFSHGTAAEHGKRVELVRSLARKAGRAIGVLVDLQGPKIRIGRFRDNKTILSVGDKFVLDAECALGDQHQVGLDYKNLPKDVRPGDTLLLDDGRIVLGVSSVKGPRITTVVEQGGLLSNNKGINRKGGGLTAPALTEKDMQDIKVAAELKADFLGISFPRSGADIRWARDLMHKAGGRALTVAKIERAEAIPALDDILDATDCIMVARGDLAVEVGDAVVPALQKRMIRMARDKNRITITATQMMESMIAEPDPDARGGFRRRQRGARRHRRGDALRRNRRRPATRSRPWRPWRGSASRRKRRTRSRRNGGSPIRRPSSRRQSRARPCLLPTTSRSRRWRR